MTNNSEIIVNRINSAIELIVSSITSDTALILTGTLVSAFAGAYGAQHIVEKGRKKGELLRELRITNSSIMISFEICNAFLNLKAQHVQPVLRR